MLKIKTKIIHLFEKSNSKTMLFLYSISLILLSVSLLNYFRERTKYEVFKMMDSNKNFLGEHSNPPKNLLEVLPYIQCISLVLFSLLGILVLALVIFIILKFNNERINFSTSFKIAISSQLIFSFQFIILAFINFIFQLHLTNILGSDNTLTALINPFFLISLFILYVLVQHKTNLSKSQLFMFIVIMFIYKIIGSL